MKDQQQHVLFKKNLQHLEEPDKTNMRKWDLLIIVTDASAKQ